MKGPSIDAIRRFKEQQEEKKRQEDEKKIKDKISILEHRASQGDRKAKQELKRIEKIKEDRNKQPEPQAELSNHQSYSHSNRTKPGQSQPIKSTTSTKRPQKVITDFEELMRLAKQNTNEIRKPDQPKPVREETKPKHVPKRLPTTSKSEVQKSTVSKPAMNDIKPKSKQPQHEVTKQQSDKKADLEQRIQAHKRREAALLLQRSRRKLELDDNDDDDYESDGFVVNEEDDDVQDELRKTLKTMFGYDRRKCDLREEELDRQYRAIGRVSTFEDLEREERRASRLAAAEDAAAFRQEEERKRKKKLSLQKS